MAAPVERAYSVTNIKSRIPLILDTDEHNYDAWRKVLLTHYLTFDVFGHVDVTSTPSGDNDQPWIKREGLVKLWIYDTLEPSLVKSSFKTGGTARDICLRIENQFCSNKEAKIMLIDNDLRILKIGDQSIRDYCQSLKSLVDLLSNLHVPVNECTLVMYMLTGLNGKFDNILNIIKHQKPFPSFDDEKSMILDEETRLKKPNKASASHSDHSSSSTALVADSSSSHNIKLIQPKNNQNFRRNNNRKNNKRCRNNNFQQRTPFPTWGPQTYWYGSLPAW